MSTIKTLCFVSYFTLVAAINASAATETLAFNDRYLAKKQLLTYNEITYFKALEKALPAKYRLFAQVRVVDLIVPKISKKTNQKQWWRDFRKVSSKHIDIVIVDQRFQVIAAIEVNDRSHLREDRKRRDKFLTEAFAGAGVPLVWQWVQKKYSTYDIHKSLEEFIQFE